MIDEGFDRGFKIIRQKLVLSRFRAVLGARSSRLAVESDGAFAARCRVASVARKAMLASHRGAWIVKAVDVFEVRHLGLPAGFAVNVARSIPL